MERVVEEFKKLVEIDSLSFKERKMADYIKEKLAGLGLEPVEDDAGKRTGGEAGNIYASFFNPGSNGSEAVLFCAHMDTVKPGEGKTAVIHEDGRITSRGDTVLGADDLTGVAAILEAVRQIREEGLPHRDVELLFTVAEEAYTAGAGAADISGLRAKTAYVLDDSGEIGLYSSTEPTLIEFTADIKGRAAHAGFEPEKGVNAVLIFANAMSRLKVGRVDKDTTVNIGEIRGGTAGNIVPEDLRLKGEIRSLVHESALKQFEELSRVFNEEAQKLGGKAVIGHDIRLHAYEIPGSSEALRDYRDVLNEMGLELREKRSFGGSDNNVFRRKGIDGICIANGMHDIHSTGEYTYIEELKQVLDITKALMINRQDSRKGMPSVRGSI